MMKKRSASINAERFFLLILKPSATPVESLVSFRFQNRAKRAQPKQGGTGVKVQQSKGAARIRAVEQVMQKESSFMRLEMSAGRRPLRGLIKLPD